MPFSSCVAHSSKEFYQRAKLLIGHNNGLCCTLLGFICGNECSLDVSEDFQDKALHVDVLLQYCSKFGSSKSKDFDLCCYPLRELGLILLQSESFLGLISCIIAPAVVFVAKFPRDFHLDFSIFTFLATCVLASISLVFLSLHSRWLLLEHRNGEPLIGGFSLKSLNDNVKLQDKIFVADSGVLGINRVASPLYDGFIADAVDLAELR